MLQETFKIKDFFFLQPATELRQHVSAMKTGK